MSFRERYDWWASLKHGGLLIAPGKLTEYFPAEVEPLSRRQADMLRRDLTRFAPEDSPSLAYLLDTVLEEVLNLDRRLWFKGNQVGPEWAQKAITGETIRPRRVWVDAHEHAFPVFVEQEVARLGVGRGRRTVSRVVEWLRKSEQKLALLTNGRQWRLIHAGADYDAWVESDADHWFVEGQPGPQVDALRLLLNPATLGTDTAEVNPLLWTAIQASRQGQAELSAELGERVRRAVELLIRESREGIATTQATAAFSNNDLYIAASRIVMRCVIILFAEARDLLPRDNSIYHTSYGLQGLREQLDRRAGGHAQERLRHSYTAWPRLLALFRLMYDGSLHEALPIPTYSGQLFAPADKTARDPINRALLAFEQVDPCPSDFAVYRILELLTKSKVKVRQGNRSTWVDAPVDFSDLSTEYIGILYQGLLDFELRQAEADEPMIFLNLGDQPVLPLSRLEGMDDAALAALVEKLKTARKPAAAEDEEADETEEEDAAELDDADEEPDEVEDDAEPAPEEDEADDADTVQQLRQRAEAWAVRAVKAGNLVAKPRSRAPEAVAAYEAEAAAFAPRLIARIVRPGEWFLVRWGGTRKGSGTFYTRPQLGVPLVRRTLQPLAYRQEGEEWLPRVPEEILDLKVCDSAMGSASLLVAALRYLTGALYESLFYHGRISAHGQHGICRLADGQLTNELIEESLPVPPEHEEFEGRLQARLKRYVVERCIYGVDLNPLAVELARLSLWIETMDPRLPFSFLDHKLKVGNALVGCWLDRFQDYPVMAWEREGGDKNHDRFIHHYREFTATRGKSKGAVEQRGDKWTQAIKEMRDAVIKPEMTVWIQQLGTRMMTFGAAGASATDLHAGALQAFEKMHRLAMTDPGAQAAIYYEQILENPAYKQLKLAFNAWCAVWFWPGDALDKAPTPLNFQDLPAESADLVEAVAAAQRFFHWELEFPDVFNPRRKGFDAMIKNPPWEILKPKSQEFFSNIDPLYRTYTKQDALASQTTLFELDARIEQAWLAYNAGFRALSNWNKFAAFPFGEGDGAQYSFTRSRADNTRLQAMWQSDRRKRLGYADKQHPFQHQGSADLNAYKMFLEQSFALAETGGQLGLIVPSGLSSDKGTSDLRQLFLDQAEWQWLFGFENKNGIFDIHRSFKFYATVLRKGGQTEAIEAAFMRHNLEDWAEAERHTLSYPRDRIQVFSPYSTAILEIRSERGLEVLEKMYANGVLLGDQSEQGWKIQYATEFHMTNDSKLFPPRPRWEQKGYVGDEYGHWLKGKWHGFSGGRHILARDAGVILSADGTQAIALEDVEDVALPLYQGVMINQFDSCAKGWTGGTGLTASWQILPPAENRLLPQYLMSLENYSNTSKASHGWKIGYRPIARTTDKRTWIGTLISNLPAGNSIGYFLSNIETPSKSLLLLGLLNSFAYDWQLRNRVSGTNLNWFVMEETALPTGLTVGNRDIEKLVIKLIGVTTRHAYEWKTLSFANGKTGWKSMWAITLHERLRIRVILDAISAYSYGLRQKDMEWILNECLYPADQASDKMFSRRLDPKGFWRVDKEKDPELRHTVLTLIAFHDLQEKGVDAFLAQNNGEGWLIPETVRLADYGLGHDDRAKEHQPVASRLGPRFLPWQLEATPEQSWAECERHAENLRLLLGDLVEEPQPQPLTLAESGLDYSPVTNLLGEPLQRDLFGNVLVPKRKRK